MSLAGCAASSTAAKPQPAGRSTLPGQSASPTPSTRDPVTGFLDRYVTADGRVVRRDQGGDIVSEGQAYAMVLANAAGRPDVTRTVWRWTAAHLLQPNGLLAFHASGGGQVLDRQAASDADTLAAYALLSYSGDDADSLHAAGRALAAAVQQLETVTLPNGRRLLAAGPWATGSPATLNPSYWMPAVFDRLASLTGDDRWTALAQGATTSLAGLTNGSTLPSDWVRANGSSLTAEPAPDGSQPQPTYGYDALRTPIFWGTACSADQRALAGTWWQVLRQGDRSQAPQLSTSGTIVAGGPSAEALAGAAVAAHAASQPDASRALLSRASAQAAATPTYYGDAVVALASLALSGRLAGCSVS